MPTPAPESRPSSGISSRVFRRRSPLLRRLQAAFGVRRLYLVSLALRCAPSEGQRLFFLTLLVGVLCGLAALAFHVAIGFSERHLIDACSGGERQELDRVDHRSTGRRWPDLRRAARVRRPERARQRHPSGQSGVRPRKAARFARGTLWASS